MQLPIERHRDEIIECVRRNQVTIVVGETGSGKTTQVPRYLYEAGFSNGRIIGITEPRRIAAISTAQYVASQLGTQVGQIVGYQIRFDDTTERQTKVKFMTDGILLREIQSDTLLSQYSVIMIDEAHERSQNIDFTLGLLKDLLPRRKDLKVIIASATIDRDKFSAYFNEAPVVNVSGQMYPVEMEYETKDIHPLDMASHVALRVLAIHENEGSGDILVFMTGDDDISEVMEALKKEAVSDLEVIPCTGALPPDEQQKIFAAYPGKRKVIIATNVAETSITVDGVVYVVDSGRIKQVNFHPKQGIQSLDQVDHSQAGCEQRKGRAGRTRPGKCFRMYTRGSFAQRPKFTTPEILRMSLAGVVLAMEDIGIADVEHFDFIDKPNSEAFNEAYETLIALGAIKRGEKGLTDIGKDMARLPLEPRTARMVLEAKKHGCVREVATVAACLSVRSLYYMPKERDEKKLAMLAHERFHVDNSDIATMLEITRQYELVEANERGAWCHSNYLNGKSLREVGNIREQLLRILANSGVKITSTNDLDKVGRAVAVGLSYNLFEHAVKFEFTGVLRIGTTVFVHPSSSLFGHTYGTRFFVATEIVSTSKTYARNCMPVPAEWLPDLVPHLARLGDAVIEEVDEGSGEAAITRDVFFRSNKGLFLGRDSRIGQVRATISLTEAFAIQREKIKKAESEGLLLLKFTKRAGLYWDEWIARTASKTYHLSSGRDFLLAMKEGASYYCEVDRISIDQSSVVPVFRVWDIVPPTCEAPSTSQEPVSSSALQALASKWGARISSGTK